MAATSPVDRRQVGEWADGLPAGPVLDLGCGPGHWTAWVAARKREVVGLDPAPGMLARARRDRPGLGLVLGGAEQLPLRDGCLAGVLAWYSLIHLHPDRIGIALHEIARVLRPGGGALLGFFTGPLARFDHAVAPAWTWPADELAGRMREAGLVVTLQDGRHDPKTRPHGVLGTRRPA